MRRWSINEKWNNQASNSLQDQISRVSILEWIMKNQAVGTWHWKSISMLPVRIEKKNICLEVIKILQWSKLSKYSCIQGKVGLKTKETLQ